MTKLSVCDLKGKELHKIEPKPEIFDGKVNLPILHQVIVGYQAGRRSGCASTKTRAEVRGGGKKPWRQKGTGRARTGSIRNPIWKGGGIVFGPRPRDYAYHLTKRARRLALKAALNVSLKDEKLTIIEGIKLDKPKTKVLLKSIKKLLAASNGRTIVVLDEIPQNTKRAAANIPNFQIKHCDVLTAIDAILADKLIISEKALAKICERISNK